MSHSECSFEKDLLTAIKSKQWSNSLRTHAATCPICKQTMLVSEVTLKYSANLQIPALPSSRVVWLRAQYARKQEYLSVLDLVTLTAASIAGLAALAGLIFWGFPQIFTDAAGRVGKFFSGFSQVSFPVEPIAVSVAVLMFVWLMSRDSFSTER